MSFFDFFGRGARRDLEDANREANAALEGGLNRAREVGDRQNDEAQGYLRPYIEGGAGANRLLYNALGINGREAQTGFYNDFQTDPGFQGEVQAGVRALDHSATARGGLYSGAAGKAIASYGQGKMADAYGRRLNMLTGVGQQGQTAAGQASATASQYGSDRMNLEYGYGQQQAGNRINLGNAMAQNRNVGMNNLLGLGGVVARGYAAYNQPRR